MASRDNKLIPITGLCKLLYQMSKAGTERVMLVCLAACLGAVIMHYHVMSGSNSDF